MKNGTPKPALTARQREIYEFLKDKIVNRGYGPTVREIGAQFGIRSPNGVMCHLKALEKKGLITRESHMSRAIQLTEPLRGATSLPLAGQIAAGSPVLAEEQTEVVDFAALFSGDDHFCLKVKGESMVEDGIHDGDLIIVERRQTAETGQTVVALIDGNEATVKRFHRQQGGKIRLEPANSSMEPMIFPEEDVQIQGVLIGLLRKYAS